MTRNESGLLDDWLRYHGYLFGFENIHVLDGSDQPEILQIYDRYLSRGLNVHYSTTGLDGLAAELNQLINRYKGDDNFLIKLDTDEFLAYTLPVLPTRGSMPGRLLAKMRFMANRKARWLVPVLEWINDRVCARKKLRVDGFSGFFELLPITGQRYKASLATWSIPSESSDVSVCQSMTTFTPPFFTQFKTFFHAASFVSVDLGSHAGVSTGGEGVIETGLVIVHYHSTSTEDSMRRARQVLLSHGYIQAADDIGEQRQKLEALKAQGVQLSFHRVDLYLRYLYSLEGGAPVRPASLNWDNPHFRSTGPAVDLTIVKDTLEMIEAQDHG